jgi:hypothetical protein
MPALSTMSLPAGFPLEYVGQRPIPATSGEIRLFSKLRNESLRLPAFLRYYRQLGVQRFFLVDNASTDGSTEFLSTQEDVHVFRTEQSFRAARGGTDWLNLVLAQFGVGGWCVTVDIDELLSYPGVEATDLTRFTHYLDAHGYQALACQLLDMYPQGPLQDCAYRAGDDLVAAAPFFDRAPYKRFTHDECPYFLLYGGMRERVFFPESRGGLGRKLHVGLYYRLLPWVPVVRDWRWLQRYGPVFPPCLTKVPLVKWDAETHYLNVNHFVSPRRVAPESGVLLHFKLFQDFHARAAQEVVRAEYYDGAIEFRRYAQTLKSRGDVAFYHEGSERFESSEQLVSLGLMQDTPAWAAARAGAGRAAGMP